MLILTRYVNDEVVMTTADGTEIVVKLIEIIHRGEARIGFHAPKSVRIDRREIHAKRQLEQPNPGKGLTQ